MFKLKDLGRYKIDRTEDYEWAKSSGEDLSYYEMLRVKGSKTEKCFNVPSNLYKYSNDELALYLKDHKNYWRPLSKLLNQALDINDEEITLKFPVNKFSDVSKIVKFVMKKGSGELSDNFIQAREKSYFKHGAKIKHINKKIKGNASNSIITLEDFKGVEK